MERIKKLCTYLDKCKTFADVGCDHGYCTRYMLENNLCESAVISDISAKCLQKAESLLSGFMNSGRVTSVCCSGLDKIDRNTEQILIAGMGGIEIANILKTAYIPHSFVFQPMKNARLVREYLMQQGAEVTKDEVFFADGKYYFVIKGKKSGLPALYSKAELEFGKNLQGAETKAYIGVELQKKKNYLKNKMLKESRLNLEAEIAFMEGVLSGEIK